VEEFEERFRPPEAPSVPPPPPPPAQTPPSTETQPETASEPQVEQPAFIPPPPPPDPEIDPLLVEQLTDDTPQPDSESDPLVVSDAPYAVAPNEPSTLERPEVSDYSPQKELREALPQPNAQFARSNKQNPLVTPGPSMPQLRTADAAPRADTPDIPPPPEPDVVFEPETAPDQPPEAPIETATTAEPRVAAAPTPRRRPKKPAVQPREQPQQPPQVASAKPQNELEDMLNNLQIPNNNPPQNNGASRRYVGDGNGPSRPGQRALWLSPFEASGLQSDLNRCVPKADTGGYQRNQLLVVVRASLTREGKIVDVQLLEPRGGLTPKQNSILRYVTNKLYNCPPFILPEKKYDDWDVVDLVIDPVSGQIVVQ
ncbi:MAG: hypothetical protein KTR21_02090, partial [Rhodobacteraceae bacterium]|nr:hypothetical protein [Paracoccaceae bacterium]